MIITTTNVGSLGCDDFQELKPENIVVRQQLFDAIASINNEGDPVDILAVQECRSFSFDFMPFFGLQLATSEEVTWGKDEGVPEGLVSTDYLGPPRLTSRMTVTRRVPCSLGLNRQTIK